MIPKQTDDIILSGELNILEAMAKNVHEVWAESRISQGWTLVQSVMMYSSTIHALSLTRNFPRWKKPMTEIRQ